MNNMNYQWNPIVDLPDDWRGLISPELESLASIWKEQSERLKQSEALRSFNVRLGRQWAIETGIIENLYSIDRGITVLLIEKGIEASLIPHGATDKPAELVISFLKDQEEVLEGLFDFVGRKRSLSTSYIKELHQAFTRNQETVMAVNGMGRLREVSLLRGEWKTLPNNPTRPDGGLHEYCPPEHVSSEMDRLMELHLKHTEDGVPAELEAAWLHHGFTQIHPFQDGNGRIARALASLIFIRSGWFPLVVDRYMREEYIEALEYADTDDLSLLINLFVRIQKKHFTKALSLSEDVLRHKNELGQVIEAAKDILKKREQARYEKMRHVFEISNHLENIVQKRFSALQELLDPELKEISNTYFSNFYRNESGNDFWFKQQIVMVAKIFDYYADTRTYRSWLRFRIRETRQTELMVSFHALGVEFSGVLVASAFIMHKDMNEDNESTVDTPSPVCKDIFQFAYNEKKEIVEERFDKWIEEVVLFGLDEWRRQL